jgi:uncharacterized protein (DUF58 family)
LVLLAVVTFYTFGTGFTFFFRFLYALLLLGAIGMAWAWLNLRGMELQLTRIASRGRVGEYVEGRIRIINKNKLPKSWLEVVEYTDLPGYSTGRGVAMLGNQSRTWRTDTFLSKRGRFNVGQVEVTSQDPLGVFRLKRRFLDPVPFTVFPEVVPLPDLDIRFAHLPSDSRTTQPVNQITTDVSAVREYNPGDSFRRIHWPYTAKMNKLMVKEFDLGLTADAWVLVDLQRNSHIAGDDDVNNTEELAVTIAASLISRFVELDMPVGLAANGDNSYIFRPDTSPEHQGRLLEALAEASATGTTSLERFLYDLRRQMSRFNTLTVITPSIRTEWVPALNSIRRQGVKVAVVLIDTRDFGGTSNPEFLVDILFANDIATYTVKKDQALNEALRFPVDRRENYMGQAPQPTAQEISA